MAGVSDAQIRDLEDELAAALNFAMSHRPEAPLSAIAERLSRHIPASNSSYPFPVVAMGAGASAKKAAEDGFEAADKDGDGKLDEPELKTSLEQVGVTGWNDARVGHLLGVLDVNGDGVVDRFEFETTCRQLGAVLAALAGPAEEAAVSPALQALRDQTKAVLAKLDAAKPSTAAASPASLPDGLKDFTPLAKEPEIAGIASGLHDLELAVARSPSSEAALAALRAEAEKLAQAMQAKINARTAEARRVTPAEELEAMWAELMPRVLEKMKEGYPRYYRDEEKAEMAQKEAVDPLQAAWEKASVDDRPRLLREATKQAGEEEIFVPLISECAAAILAGNRDFQKIYHAVYDVIRSGEAGSVEAAKEGIRALGQAVCGDPKQLQQRGEAAETVTLLADAAGALPAFAELVRCLSWATGAR